MTPNLIGLSGYAQSGKDTVAEILVREYDYTRIAFADPIRNLLYEVNPTVGTTNLRNLVDADGWDAAKQNHEVRRLLQDLGVGARKIFGYDFWINSAMLSIHNRIGILKGKYVFTDVRFENEAETIRNYKGAIWRIERSGVTAVNNHVSEHELDHYDFDKKITNDSSIEDLESKVRHAVESMN